MNVPPLLSSQKLPSWFNLGLAFPLIFLNGWLILLLCSYLQPATNIVLTASLAAFVLNYPIVLLENRGIPRGAAVGLVILAFLLVLGVIGLGIGPLVVRQLVEFGDRLPLWIDQGRKQLESLDQTTVLQYLPIDIPGLTTQLTSQLTQTLRSITSRFIDITLGTINGTVNFFVTVVLTILLVLNGKRLWDGICSWFPDKWNTRIQTSLQASFQNYFAGQTIVASILSAVLSLAFIVLQVPFGLLFGLGIGVASLIPFGGTVSILLVSVLLSFQNIWLGVKVLVAALILGQINENAIAPRLLGGFTGLNPALVLMSLLIGVKISGVLGLLLAVPTASFVKRMADTLRNPQETIELID